MKTVSFDGVGSVLATFLCDEQVKPGDVVAMGGDDRVSPCTAGQPPCGVAVSVAEDGYAAVQLGGAATLRYSGAGVAAGWKSLCSDGTGGVRGAASGDVGRQYLVLSVDTAGKTAVVLL